MKRRKKSIRTKIILLFIIVVAFQISVTALFAITQLKPYITNLYDSHQSQMSNVLFEQLTNDKLKIENYSVNIIGDKDIQNFLKEANESDILYYSHEMTTLLRNRILSYTEYDNRIKTIYLMDNHNNLYRNYIDKSIDKFIEDKSDILQEIESKPTWNSYFNGKDIIMYRVINNTTTNLTEKIGTIFIVIDGKMFTDTLEYFAVDTEQEYLLISKDNRMKIGDADLIVEYDYSNIRRLIENEDKYISNCKENEEWALFTWSYKDVAYRPLYIIMQILSIELVGLLLLTIGLIIFLSGKITKPIANIRNAMRQMGKGNMGINIMVTSDDEIGELVVTMNRMSKRIQELVLKIKEDQKKQRLLELRSMQYQINPHFLYNTLDTINMFARKYKDIKASELVTTLSDYYRISLNRGHEFLKISEEVKHALRYLEIQSIRFPNKFNSEIYIEKGLENIKILKLILQPLVENSINHGLRNDSEGGYIWLNIYSKPGLIILEIKDNGSGMLPEKLEQLRKEINEEDTETDPQKGGFGMRNVHQRLKMCYGEAYGLQIESEWDVGTVITITIPRNEQLTSITDNQHEKFNF